MLAQRASKGPVRLSLCLKPRLNSKLFRFFNKSPSGDPLAALTPYRFDIPAKTLFARAILDDNTSLYPQNLYLEHLRVWNGFFEDFPRKTCKEDYISSFHEIIAAHKTNSFVHNRSPIPMSTSGHATNGSHRIASAIIQGKGVLFDQSHVHQTQIFDFRHFRYKGLSETYLDSMALEYLRLCTLATHMVVLYPTIDLTDETASNILREFSNIVYEKTLEISSAGRVNFIHQLYYGESWITKRSPPVGKAEASFGTGKTSYQIKVILIETTRPLADIAEAKQRIRNHFNYRDGIHITDTKQECERVGKMVFNHNSIHLINNQDLSVPTPRFDELFLEYSFNSTCEERCIDSGGVLAAYGLRDVGGDLDYIYRTTGEHPKESHGRVTNHLSELPYFTDSFDEIITNPSKHFYYVGHKFATLEVVEGMKKNRNEIKDRNDIMLIESVGHS
jgi:hypothetical protein